MGGTKAFFVKMTSDNKRDDHDCDGSGWGWRLLPNLSALVSERSASNLSWRIQIAASWDLAVLWLGRRFAAGRFRWANDVVTNTELGSFVVE